MSLPPTKTTMGDRGTNALKTHVASGSAVDIRQTRRGWLMELLCPCDARPEFKYFVNNVQVAHSIEDSNGCCCSPCYAFTVVVKEQGAEAELLKVERPCTMCGVGYCKCCCYQTAHVSSGGLPLGHVKETCFFCVPSFKLYDANDNYLYLIHPPTCCGGICVNCCAEGNPCTQKGCCKASFRIFDPQQESTNGDAPYVGKILKRPKSLLTEVFTDADSFEVTFPRDANVSTRGVLIGTAVFFNALFFERSEDKQVCGKWFYECFMNSGSARFYL